MGWLYASPPHRGRGVDSGGERRRVVPVKLTFEKMAAVMYGASVSILHIPPCLSVGRATARSGCGTWERARSSRKPPAINPPPPPASMPPCHPCRRIVGAGGGGAERLDDAAERLDDGAERLDDARMASGLVAME